jgi:hypothetical protein
VERLLQFLVIGGATLAPLFAWGHGADCVQAKLSLEGREVVLSMVADYGVNPLIADEAEARQVLASCLEFQQGDRMLPLRELGAPQYQADARFDPASPMPPMPGDDGHKLVGCVYRWSATSESLRFHVPKGSIHNVLLWKMDQGEARWTMLLGDESSPVLHVLPQPMSSLWLGLFSLIAVVFTSGLLKGTSSFAANPEGQQQG